MPIQISVTSQQATEDCRNWFRRCARTTFSGLSVVRQRMRVPACHVEVRLVDDFEDDVRRLGSQPTFTADRAGGRAVAKSLPQTEDWSRVVLLFDSSEWLWQHDLNRVTQLYLMAHELAHPIINRARVAAGVSVSQEEAAGGAQLARHLCRALAEEYWADIIADTVVGALVSVTTEGQTTKGTAWQSIGERHLFSVHTVLDAANAKWPDTVDKYRHWDMDLQKMWLCVARSIHQTLMTTVHAQALADGGGVGDLLKMAPFSDMPAVCRYLKEPWEHFLNVLRQSCLFCRPERFQAHEDAVLEAGQHMMVEIWARLGLQFVELPDGQYWLSVGEPVP